MAILRSILGVVVGLVLGSFLVGVLEFAGHIIFPPPPGMDPTSMESIREHLPNLPVGAFVSVLVAWTIGVFAGSLVSALIAGRASFIHAGIVGVIFLGFCVLNLVMIPHPVWFLAATIVAVPLATLGGALLGKRPPDAKAEPAQNVAK